MSSLLSKLFLDDYSSSGCAGAPTTSRVRVPSNEANKSDTKSPPHISYQEAEDLCRQLQLLKRQTMAALDQSVKSSERELSALYAAKDSAKAEQAAKENIARAM